VTGRTRGFTPERIAWMSLYVIGLMWTLPFLVPFKAPPVPSFHAEALAAVLGLVALSALPAFAGRLELPRVAWLLLGFTGLIIVQMLFGRLPYRQVGLLAALYLLWAIGLVMLGGLLRRELGLERVASTLSWFLLAGALASAVIGWAQHIESDALGRLAMPLSLNRVWANLGQANQLADYLTLGLASAAYLCATDRLPLRWAAPAVVALSYILSLTGSRTAWVYLPGLIALSAVFWGSDHSRSNRRLLVLCMLALAASIVLPWLDGLLFEPNLSTAAARLGSSEITAEERPRIWRAALLMFLDSPLFGVGFRQFGWHHFELNGQAPEPRMLGFTDHAHNLPLHMLAEFGLVGLALLAVFAALWVAGLVRQQRTPAHWWVWAMALVMGVHSLLEYPLWYTFFLGVAAMVLGLGEPRTMPLQLGRQGRTGRLLLVGLLALGWLVAGQLLRDYLVLENFLAFRYRYIHASAALNRQAKEMLLEIHRSSLLAQYVELGLARTISVDTDRLADKLAVNGRAMHLFPIDDVTYRQAMLLALRGEQAAAQRQWDLAAASYPELRNEAMLVVKRRVEDGLTELRPLLEYTQKRNRDKSTEGGAN
jgi:O-antigen ligase